jgi:hypothetical protein
MSVVSKEWRMNGPSSGKGLDIERLRGLLDGSYTPPPPPPVNLEEVTLFGGLDAVDLEGQSYEIFEGLNIVPTYAHCFSYWMAAFNRPPNDRATHPAPWHALRGGGIAFDIEAELQIRVGTTVGGLDRLRSLQLCVSLIRLLAGATVRMPMISDTSFALLSLAGYHGNVFATEGSPLGGRTKLRFDKEFAEGVRACLLPTAELLKTPEFKRAFELYDAVNWLPTPAARITAIWTSIETAMRPGRRDIARNLARSLGNLIGVNRSERDRIFNRTLALYNERGSAVHDSQHPEGRVIRDSQLLARSMFISLIAARDVPPLPAREAVQQ